MGVKKGEKLTDNPKDIMLRTRIDKDTYDKLDEAAKILNVKKAEIVRRGIEHEYKEAKKQARSR